eukprot:gnl/TRDRNA2_/TRDRNA2_175088_c0_seq2.p1 gnl/TRDRNA2_/TRDRNA2_175088_c0~~gnl/TRDRNA2_/TRDRNA2_175088_c0_seq2.p1  ORF type:complete len:755 (+),score=311.28 gnl/TRDRNA2_/TRDRNA2_175088_c0_seq2:113-2377(+)
MMMVTAVLLALVAMTGSATAKRTDVDGGDTIGKVVDMLKEMLDKSKDDGVEEREVFAKFKCYCDKNKKEKTETVEDNTKEIVVLDAKINELQGDNGVLSSACAKLDAHIAENEEGRKESESMRKKAHDNFVAEETDLTTAIGQMNEAIDTLAEVGADQTSAEAAADHEKFMAGWKDKDSASLQQIKASVKQALIAAKTFLTSKQQQVVQSFVQAPFTGSYSAQSGEVVGILKNMRDTFKSNLASARTQEEAQSKAFDKFMETKKKAYDEMKESFDDKQEKMASNSGDLEVKKESFASLTEEKADAEAFLAKLIPMCKEKQQEYEERKMLRSNEEAAVAKAMSILSSSKAAKSFKKTEVSLSKKKAKVSLIQSRIRHRQVSSPRAVVEQLFQKAALSVRSKRLVEAVKLLKTDNPFDQVLKEIETMIEAIDQEEKSDKEQFEWCETEREEIHGNKENKKGEINDLETAVDDLKAQIEDPEAGIKAEIKEKQELLEENHQSQVDETDARREENTAYQKSIANFQLSQETILKAKKVLEQYYDGIKKEEELIKIKHHTVKGKQEPPSTWKKDSFSGQTKKGSKVIKILDKIMNEVWDEEALAHKDEATAQHAYEDSMAELRKEQADTQTAIIELKEKMAEKKKNLFESHEDLHQSEKDLKALKNYLEEIKPGCDFIEENYDERKKNRKEEKEALKDGLKELKSSPTYKEAMKNAELEAMGECKDTCVKDKEHAECKACLAGVSEPAYCAGHKGVKGC